MSATSLEEVFGQIRAARMAVMVAGEGDECEGDLVMAAEKVTPADVNFMVRHARGVVSVALPEKRIRELGIPLVSSSQGDNAMEQAGALVESRLGVTTGISANDRARTIQVLASAKSGPEDIVMPGHVLPLMALSGGVMLRMGRAEGAVDLVRSAGMRPSAAMCAILREDGEAAQLPELREFAETHELPVCHIRDLVSYRLTNEILVQRVAESEFTLLGGDLQALVFRNIVDGREHLALIKGQIGNGRPALVRLHSECLTGDVFGSQRCDCGEQLEESIRRGRRWMAVTATCDHCPNGWHLAGPGWRTARPANRSRLRLVMLRSTFNAEHSRTYSSTIDSHLSGLPASVLWLATDGSSTKYLLLLGHDMCASLSCQMHSA